MKKRILTLAVILNVIGVSVFAQEFELIESYSLADIQDEVSDLGIPSAFFSPDNGIDFYSVTYETTHPNGDVITVSGALCLPQLSNCDLAMATYQHGTVFSPEDVPSNLNDEAIIGILYASKGYIVPMPDYIGLGVSSQYVHPYVHAESEAQAGLDLIRAVRDAQDQLEFGWNEQLFIYGYSQGGHAAAALQRKIETEFSEEFTVTASVPMSGPYDLSGAQTDVILSGEPYPTPGYLPYLMIGYQDVYGGIYTDLEEILTPEYAVIVQDYVDGNSSLDQTQALLPDVPIDMLQADFLEDFTNNPENPLMVAIRDNDLLDWTPVAPTRLIYCNADDQVNYLNSVNALEAWEENGALSVDGIDGGNFDHGGCLLPALLGGLYYFEDYVDAPLEFTINFSVDDDAGGTEVGSITANIDSENTYTLVWGDGTEGNVLSGLIAGTYILSVISEGGCSQDFEVVVDDSVGINELETDNFKIYPNPTVADLNIVLNQPFSGAVSVVDLNGKTVLKEQVSQTNQVSLNMSRLSTGMYVLKIENFKPVIIVKE